MIRANPLSLTPVFAVLLLSAPLMADSTVTMNDDTVVQIRNGMARMVPAGERSYMVYDSGRNVLIHVDPDEGTYMELDEHTMQKQAAAMDDMRTEMAAQMEAMRGELQNLPEAQRRMIEQQMGAMMGRAETPSAPKPSIKTVKKGSRAVKGFKCNEYRMLEGTTPVADVCIAEKPGGGMSRDDFATLSAMMTFIRSMAQEASEMAGSLGGGFDPMMAGDIQGFPVEVKDHRSGEQYGVASVANGELTDALFNEYKKLRKEEMPGISGR